jgi:ankyrin repeat protein
VTGVQTCALPISKDIVNHYAENGDTILDFAFRYDNIEVIKLLLERSAPFNFNSLLFASRKAMEMANKANYLAKAYQDREKEVEEAKKRATEEARKRAAEEARKRAAEARKGAAGLLCCFIRDNDIANLQDLLSSGMRNEIIDVINEIDPVTDKHPLSLAAEANSRAIVELLLNNYADPNSVDLNGVTDLNIRELIHEKSLANNLLDNVIKGNANGVENTMQEIREISMQKQNKAFLLKMANSKDKDENPLLNIAVKANNFDIVKLLLDNGAYPSFNGLDENSIIYDIRSIIIKKTWANGLFLRIRQGNFKEVQDIVLKNKELKFFLLTILNDKDENGSTPLMLAVELNNFDIVKLLLDNGVDPNSVDIQDVIDPNIRRILLVKQQANYLHAKVIEEDYDAVNGIISRYKKDEVFLREIVNCKDEDGRTPFFSSVGKEDKRIERLLYDYFN